MNEIAARETPGCDFYVGAPLFHQRLHSSQKNSMECQNSMESLVNPHQNDRADLGKFRVLPVRGTFRSSVPVPQMDSIKILIR